MRFGKAGGRRVIAKRDDKTAKMFENPNVTMPRDDGPIARSLWSRPFTNSAIIPDTGWRPPTTFPSLKGSQDVTIDLETYDPKLHALGPGFLRGDAYVIGVAIHARHTNRETFTGYYPLRHRQGGVNFEVDKVSSWLKDELGGPEPKIGANLLYDLEGLLVDLGVPVSGPLWDVQNAEGILDEESALVEEESGRGFALDKLGKKYVMSGKAEDAFDRLVHNLRLKNKGELKRALRDIAPQAGVGEYAEQDVRLPAEVWDHQKKLIAAQNLGVIWQLETDLVPILLEMRMHGVRVDVEGAEKVAEQLDADKLIMLDELASAAGEVIDPWKPGDLVKLCDRLGVEVARTAAGNPSFTAGWLKGQTNPLFKNVLEIRQVEKMSRDFVRGVVMNLNIKGRLHAQFHQLKRSQGDDNDEDGTRSGRFSCVSGATILDTSRGCFCIKDYEPRFGDLIETHTGRWMPVIRKIYKGIDQMFEVRLNNGAILECTKHHRILTPTGWRAVKDLIIGSEVISDGRQREAFGRSVDSEASDGRVLLRREAVTAGHREGRGNQHEDGMPDSEGPSERGTVQGREGDSLFKGEDRRAEPYEGQEWRVAPKLQGRLSRWSWLLHAFGRRCSISSSQDRLRNTAEDSRVISSVRVSSTSHRRGSLQQSSRQFGTRYGCRSPITSQKVCFVTAINALEDMAVWDLEVEGDHSYVAGGFINHNSTNPNLQQIPKRNKRFAPLIRGLFLPDEGRRWVCGDYNSQEFRLLAHYAARAAKAGLMSPMANEAALTLMKRYQDTPALDYHQNVADMASISRDVGKPMNLMLVYGAGKRKVAVSAGWITETQFKDRDFPLPPHVEEIFTKYHAGVPFVKELLALTSRLAESRGYVTTILGRRAHFELWQPRRWRSEIGDPLPLSMAKARWPDEPLVRADGRKALNRIIQGSAADMTKKAMVDLRRAGILAALTVHDELDPSLGSIEEAITMHRVMVEAIPLDVPVLVDMGHGMTWADANKSKFTPEEPDAPYMWPNKGVNRGSALIHK